ncbi:MAG: hypothetical protein NT175_08690 [Bacteroidetes bacterium]|nr:hypothetical protein [Bacteroidota bacterium]
MNHKVLSLCSLVFLAIILSCCSSEEKKARIAANRAASDSIFKVYRAKEDSIRIAKEARYRPLPGPPSKAWVGRTIKVDFGLNGWGRGLAGLVVEVKLIGIDDTEYLATHDNGDKIFLTEKPFGKLTESQTNELWFAWFDFNNRPHLEGWKEVVSN